MKEFKKQGIFILSFVLATVLIGCSETQKDDTPWIEIFDVNEQKIYFDLGRTGDQVSLNGTAPFDVILGFAQGVTIELNGKLFDQSPYTRGGVARFKLEE